MTKGQTLPAGACDCHVHLIGPPARYPMAAARRYTPGLASAVMLQEHMQQLGLQRAVIVQPSVYGTDNQCLLDSLAALTGAARGVAVPPADVCADSLCQMYAQGVRGIRFNLESLGSRDTATLSAQLAHWSARIAEPGWHIQLYAAAAVIAPLAAQLASLPVPVVLDHFGQPAAAREIDTVVALLASGNVWVKLSAPYRLAAGVAARACAQAYLRVAPHRVLWASDWPHTARDPQRQPHETTPYRDISPTTLATTLRQWLPTAALRQQVLVDNPAVLYGF